jgi:hypothetical protein
MRNEQDRLLKVVQTRDEELRIANAAGQKWMGEANEARKELAQRPDLRELRELLDKDRSENAILHERTLSEFRQQMDISNKRQEEFHQEMIHNLHNQTKALEGITLLLTQLTVPSESKFARG